MWGWDQLHEAPARTPTGLWQTLSKTILPTPATANQRLSLAAQVLCDFFLIVVGFALTGWFDALLSSAFRSISIRSLDSLAFPFSTVGLLLLYGAVFTLLGYSERLYHPETPRQPRLQTVVLAKVVFWSTALVCIGCLIVGGNRLSIVTLAAAAPVNFVIMFVYRRTRQRVPPHGWNASHGRNVLIVGTGPVGRKLAYALERDPKRVVRGFLDANESVAGDVLGRVEELATIARKEFIDEIILAVPPHCDVAQQAIWQARRNRIDVKLVPDLLGANPSQVTLEKFGDTAVLTLSEEQIPLFGLLLKRIVDVLLSGTALVLTAPVLAAIALAIKLDSPGPVLYRAPRLGRKGRRFLCYKFRTMVTEADKLKETLRERNEREGAFFKMRDDPRITRVGKALRRYSLDELPQLWNVLRGEMSLVGPRPHPLDDVQRYQLEDLQRLEVTPGLTGLWQITARRDPSFERSMALDREYIGRWSLGMDLWILCKTVGAVLRGEGA
jgi:exopolysaccharide biosynthesis polyprenyl glycosylphosphotransferase